MADIDILYIYDIRSDMKKVLPREGGSTPRGLFDFLLQCVKFRGGEELAQGDSQSITELFDGDDAGIFALSVQNAFDGGLWHSGLVGQAVGGEAVLGAELADAKCGCLLRVHRDTLQ